VKGKVVPTDFPMRSLSAANAGGVASANGAVAATAIAVRRVIAPWSRVLFFMCFLIGCS